MAETKKKSTAKKSKEKNQPELNIRGEKPVLLQVLPSLDDGGVERGTMEIAKAARDAGFTSIVASSGGKYVELLAEQGIVHIRLPLASKELFTIWMNSRRLKKIIDKYRVDIVHARSRVPAWSAYYAAKKGNAHFMTTFHGTYGMTGFLKKFYNSVMVKGEKIIAISDFIHEYIRNHFKEIPDSQIKIIRRGVDLEYFNPNKIDAQRMSVMERILRPHKDYPVIFVPARITRWKGQDFVLKALTKLPHREWTCVFAGKRKKYSKYLEELKRIKSIHNLRGNISIIESIDDMPAAYKRADLVISPALEPEAFGRVAVEAQAMGVPLIATDIGGSRETVIKGKTGFLVEPGNEEALAEQIEKIFRMHNKTKASMGRKARAHVKDNFSLKKMTDATIELYREILSSK